MQPLSPDFFPTMTPDFVLRGFLTGLYLFLSYAVFFGPLLLIPLEGAYAFRRKAFQDKLAFQALQCLVGTGIFACLTGGLIAFADGHVLLCALPRYLFPAGGLSVLSLALLLLVHRKLRSVPFLRFGITLCLVVPSIAFLIWDTGLSRLFETWTFDFLHVASAVFPASLPSAVFSGLAAAPALTLIWLILRRNRADYGRDYYAFAVRVCARQALVWTILWAAAIFFREYALRSDLRILMGAFIAPLAACILWLAASMSSTPLRHKPGIILACLFLLLLQCLETCRSLWVSA